MHENIRTMGTHENLEIAQNCHLYYITSLWNLYF